MTDSTLHFLNLMAFNLSPAYRAVAEAVGRRLGADTTFAEGASFDAFRRKEVAVGFVCGLPYTAFTALPEPPFDLLAAPQVAGDRYDGPVYFSDVIVRRDAPFTRFDDLAGARFAFNEEVSHSGYHTVRYFLLGRGHGWSFFGELVKSGRTSARSTWSSTARPMPPPSTRTPSTSPGASIRRSTSGCAPSR